jgi:hypothetical protein
MKKGDVVSIVTAAGEFVGKLVDSDAGIVTLDDPRMLVMSEEGMGFARGICMTGKDSPRNATFSNVIIVTPTNSDVSSAWRQHTSGIVV